MVLEGLGRSLDPKLDILEAAKPFLLKELVSSPWLWQWHAVAFSSQPKSTPNSLSCGSLNILELGCGRPLLFTDLVSGVRFNSFRLFGEVKGGKGITRLAEEVEMLCEGWINLSYFVFLFLSLLFLTLYAPWSGGFSWTPRLEIVRQLG